MAYNLTEIVVSGLTNSVAKSINNHGTIVGYGTGSNGTVGFADSGGNFTFLSVPGSTATFANGINDAGDIVGYYTDSAGRHGFKYSGGAYTTIDAPATGVTANTTTLTAINNLGQIAGDASLASCPFPGLVPFVDSGGSFTFASIACGETIGISGMNDPGELVGGFGGVQLPNSAAYGTVNSIKSVFANGGSAFTAINNHGHIALAGNDGTTYILTSPTDQGRNIDVAFPGALTTSVWGLNDADKLVGSWIDSAKQSHAFVGAAGPPPVCTITGSAGPPRQLTLTVQDTSSGLSQIVAGAVTNANLVIPSFPPGTTSPVYVTATADDPSASASAGITATNNAGTSTSCSSRIYAGPPQWTSVGGILLGNVAVGSNLNGSLEGFGIGSDGQLWHIVQTGPGGPWGQWQALTHNGMQLVGDPSVVLDNFGLLQVFVISNTNQPFVLSQVAPGSWFQAKWQQLPSSGVQGRPAGILTNGPVMFARASDNSVQSFGKSTMNTTSGWSATNNFGGVIIGNPAAVVDANGNPQLYAIGTDNALWSLTFSNQQWISLGGSLQGDPQAISGSGTLYVFARGTDNALWFNSEPAGGPWTGWRSLGGILIDNPKAVVNSDGRVEVFVAGADNAVWHRAQFDAGSAGWSDWSSLGGFIFGDVFPIVDSGGILNLFVIGGDHGVWQMTQSVPDTWQ
jgi:probable HAF family extracellular repeat protein